MSGDRKKLLPFAIMANGWVVIMQAMLPWRAPWGFVRLALSLAGLTFMLWVVFGTSKAEKDRAARRAEIAARKQREHDIRKLEAEERKHRALQGEEFPPLDLGDPFTEYTEAEAEKINRLHKEKP